MIVLLSYSTDLLSKEPTMIPSTGRDIQDSIKVSIDDIRKANSKLIQLDYEREINNKLREASKLDSIAIEQARQRNRLLDSSYKQVKKQRNVCGIAAIVLLIMYLIK